MQKAIHSTKDPIHAKVTIPGSKSLTLRALLLAALADGVSEISALRISKNTRIFINTLRQLGIVIQLDEATRSCIIAGGNGKFPKKQASVWSGGSKTILRFLLAACSATPGVFYFDGLSLLRKQPLNYLLEILCRQGTQLIPSDANQLPFTLIGSDTLEGGGVVLDNEATSRLASALLMIAPYARSPLNLNISNLINHHAIDMTLAIMAEYGVLVHRIHQGQFMVPVPQRYQAKDYTVEPDFSLAAYFLAAAAVTGGEVTIQPTKYTQSKQLDVKFVSVLEKIGCRVHETHAGLTLRGPAKLQGIEISMRNFSDTFFALAAIAPFAQSPTRIAHLGPIRKSEVKRMIAMKVQLVKMGVQVETGEDWIKIFPSLPKATLINPDHDPHLVMAFSLIGLKTQGMVIDNAECVAKLFPDFFHLWDKLVEHTNISA